MITFAFSFSGAIPAVEPYLATTTSYTPLLVMTGLLPNVIVGSYTIPEIKTLSELSIVIPYPIPPATSVANMAFPLASYSNKNKAGLLNVMLSNVIVDPKTPATHTLPVPSISIPLTQSLFPPAPSFFAQTGLPDELYLATYRSP